MNKEKIVIKELDEIEKIFVSEDKRGETLVLLDPSPSSSIGKIDYNKAINKPSIENVELMGNKTFIDLGAVSLTNIEIENLLNSQV